MGEIVRYAENHGAWIARFQILQPFLSFKSGNLGCNRFVTPPEEAISAPSYYFKRFFDRKHNGINKLGIFPAWRSKKVSQPSLLVGNADNSYQFSSDKTA